MIQTEALAQQLHALLSRIDCARPALAVALSGGLDSMVLLHIVSAYAAEKCLPHYAFHIHHGLSQHADVWQQFCLEQAQAQGFIFATERVTLPRNPACGIEQAARTARYSALRTLCARYAVPVLLLAHHEDDQAETVLLQLIRGAGLAGLAAMPQVASLGKEGPRLLRPFLYLPREQLADYAREQQLPSIEDDSNQDQTYARNALRQEVMPRLARIRSGYRKGLVRSAALLAQANEVLLEVALADLAAPSMIGAWDEGEMAETPPLFCATLRQLSRARASNLLRYWLTCQGLRAPSAAKLGEMLKQLTSSNPQARPSIQHGGQRLHISRGRVRLESSAALAKH
jgi:tRNA(Ile)-lysidine synthase